MQNDPEIKLGWQAFQKEFAAEIPLVRIHILVHAIHLLVAEQLFPKRIKAIRSYTDDPAYVRSWQIVDERGAAEIVAILRNKTVNHH